MNRLRKRSLRLPAAWGVLALMLVLTQLIGQWHLLAHGAGSVAAALHAVHVHPAGEHHAGEHEANEHEADEHGTNEHHAGDDAPHGWLGRLFCGHHSIDCQVIDQLSTGQAPGTPAVVLHAQPAPSALVLLWRAPVTVARTHAVFNARAPPCHASAPSQRV